MFQINKKGIAKMDNIRMNAHCKYACRDGEGIKPSGALQPQEQA